MKKQKLKISPAFPIITFWIKPNPLSTEPCINSECSSISSFNVICYEDIFEATKLTHIAGFTDQTADQLLWQKSVFDQTHNKLTEYGTMNLCEHHFERALTEIVGAKVSMLYMMPVKVMGVNIDAVVFRYLKEPQQFNLVLLHHQFKTIQQVQQLLIEQKDVMALNINH